MLNTNEVAGKVAPLARAGFSAKCIVYCLLGILVFMAAFRLNGQSPSETDKEGVFSFVGRQTGGQVLLGIIALGLLCYSIWRIVQAITDTEDKGTKAKGIVIRLRYLFSGLVYGSLTFFIARRLFAQGGSGGNSKQGLVKEILQKPLGQWVVGILAVGIAAVGIYQIYYGLSEKYKNHVNKAVPSSHRKLLLTSGKIGYVARGVVWLVLGWFFLKAAYQSNSSQAGDSSQVFQFLSTVSYGSVLLAAMGVGLISYGIFNYVRARYEQF